MAERETPAHEHPPSPVPSDFTAAGYGAGADHRERRRRLLKAGAAAAPVVMTLLSRSAWGQNFQCKTPSGFLSGNLSQNGNPQLCSGLTPEVWVSGQGHWPAPYYPTTIPGTGGHDATTFHPLFAGSFFGNQTLLEVMQNSTGGGTIALGGYISAALLNAAAGLTSVLSVAQVINIWAEFVANGYGYFEPSAGVKWYADDIIIYLKSTMT